MSDEGKEGTEDKKTRILEEMLRWIKVTSIPKVTKLLSDTLQSDEEKLAYDFSDGRTSEEIASLSGTHHSTVTRWWKKWSKLGLVELIGVKGGERARRVFSLEDFGIKVPEVKGATKRSE